MMGIVQKIMVKMYMVHVSRTWKCFDWLNCYPSYGEGISFQLDYHWRKTGNALHSSVSDPYPLKVNSLLYMNDSS